MLDKYLIFKRNLKNRLEKESKPLQKIIPERVIPWYKRLWIIISATTIVLASIILNAPTLLKNARDLPKEMRETERQYLSWLKEDTAWTGHWSSFPEGIVDMQDMNLSDTDIQITIWASEGNINGTIATKSICESIPVLSFILIRGEVYGDTAIIIVWDIIDGYKTDFAELKLVRDRNVITVTPITDPRSWFPSVARIGKHPFEPENKSELHEFFCKEEIEQLMKNIHSSF